LENADLDKEVANPLCGDIVRVQIIILENTITAAMFQGKGCVISQAAASLLTEYIVGKNINFIKQLGTQDMLDLVGLSLGPTRARCALLAFEALHAGIKEFQS
jgi:nitrogen fixation NifU-like protein